MVMVLGVDVHKDTHTVVAVDDVGRAHGERTIRATDDGHRQLLEEQSSRPVDEELLGGFRLMVVVGSFHELAVDECRTGTHEGDQVRGVHRPPAVLGGLNELERHRQPRGA